MPYQHFALEEGDCLAGFWEKGQGIRVAARMPQRPPSAASRGLGRNRGKRGYHPYGAYSKAKHRGRMPRRLLQRVWGGEAGICGDGLKCGALEPGAGCGAMGEGISRHRTGLSGTLPAHQAGLLPRGQRQGTPAPPGEAEGGAQGRVQYNPPGAHHPGTPQAASPCPWACRRQRPLPPHPGRNKAPMPPTRGAWVRQPGAEGTGRRCCRPRGLPP